MALTFIGGLDLKFFPDSELELLEHIALEKRGPVMSRNTLRLLMMGWPKAWTQFLSWPVFKAIFIHRDPNLLKELRLTFQQGFESIFNQLQGTQLNHEQMEQFQLYLSNCLSLLPYTDITPYESIKIPQFINDQWLLVEYYVTPIELTPVIGFKSWFVHDRDRVFAYGLQPIEELQATPHLIFMGTTYPAGQGFISQVNSDFKGLETVGNSLYKTGRKNLINWISQQQHKLHVCGVSLGGSLALLLAIDHGDSIARVDALNPAGLDESGWKKHYDNWDTIANKPQVVIQEQGNDPVSLFGFWKPEWQILKVTPPLTRQGPNAFFDHFLNYAGFPDTQFTYADAKQENLERKTRNFWLYYVGRSILYYAAIAPFVYIVRPIAYGIYNNWGFLLGGVNILLGVTALIALSVVGGMFTFILASSLIATLTTGLIWIIKSGYQQSRQTPAVNQEQEQVAQIHKPSLPRNPGMDIYNPQNSIAIELTHSEINTYYRIMRCLVKKKDFLPGDDKHSKLVKNLSKRDLLIASENPDNKDIKVELTTTKAKAIHIRQVLTLVAQLGLENEKKLKHAASSEYKHYNYGKQQHDF